HMMFFKKNVKTPLLLEVKVGFVYGLRPLHCKGLFNITIKRINTNISLVSKRRSCLNMLSSNTLNERFGMIGKQ
ncbi:hypothetical protein, partial [Bacillus pumilus]|uniref:hypothetical protein n=1 Tax=Bacillus pumilus TaxID=1408 RepID=UPI001C93060B